MGKLKHSWPDGGRSSNSSTPPRSTSPPRTVGKLNSPYGKGTNTDSTPVRSTSPPRTVGKLNSPFGKPSGSTPAPSSTPAPKPGGVGKLKVGDSPFGKKPASNTSAATPVTTPAKSPVKKWSPPAPSSSSPPKGDLSPPPSNTTMNVKIQGGAFTAKDQSDQSVAEAFIEGELIIDGGDVSLKEVAENLKKPNFLEKLVLKDCGVGNDFVVDILAKHMADIVYVDLSKNNLSEEAQMDLIRGALGCKVETLKLNSNKQITQPNCDRISVMMKDNHTISEFEAEFEGKPAKFDSYLERNRKVNGYAQRIKEANSTMDLISRRLSVRNNDLVTTMIRAEENDPSIKEINIFQDPRFAHIQNTLVVGFAEGLRTNLNLKKLTMKGLDLGNIFLSGLSSSIEYNFTLVEIDLSNNAFTSDGMSEFSQAMALNESILKVDLRHQHSPIFSHSEEIVLAELAKNHFVKEYHVEFKTPECAEKLNKILDRNKQEKKTIDYDKKLMAFLAQEAETVEEMAEQRKAEAKPLDIPEDDWEYFYQLEQLANQFKFKFKEEEGDKKPKEQSERKTIRSNLNSKRRPSRSVSDLGGMNKKINITAVNFTSDGAFLTEEFITSFIRDNPEDKSVTFDFMGQFKMFKRFPVESPDRAFIVGKFADVLLDHPRSSELTHINMSNSFLGNDWVVYFCEKCAKDKKYLPKLHSFNLETNFISEPGVIALSKCIASKESWKYLQAVKLENQKFLLSSKAENHLAKALYVNRSVITVNLRVRNIHERVKIEKYIYRNIDLLRQARRKHQIKTGTLKERKRNKVEQFFDKVAADDPSITEIDMTGDNIFIALNAKEKLKAAEAFATNTHVTKVKMTLLKLDDKFGVALGKALKSNTTTAIEHLILENNNFSGEAIKEIVGCLASNKTIVEMQLRHQGKNMASSDESQLAGLMGDNETVVKFGCEIRHMQAKNEVERKLRKNQDLARKNRKKGPARSKSSEGMIKKVNTQRILDRVVKNDKEIKAVVLNNDEEFLKTEGFRKKEFYEGLKKNTFVTTLTMNDLKLDNEFGDELLSILATNSTITSISINKNFFTSLGVYTIVDGVIKAKNVKKLSILKPRAKISAEEADRLLDCMEKESYLHELEIDFRESAQTERLKKILEGNKSK